MEFPDSLLNEHAAIPDLHLSKKIIDTLVPLRELWRAVEMKSQLQGQAFSSISVSIYLLNLKKTHEM